MAGLAHAETPGLVAQWRFDEPDGQSALDDGPFGLTGQLGASAEPDAADPVRIAGASRGALHFDGGELVRLPESSRLELQAMTIQAVVRAPASPGAWRYVLSRGARGCFAGSYGLYTAAAGGIALYVFDGRRYVVSAVARIQDVWDGRWHQIAGTFDGSALRLYVDGRPVGAPMAAPLRVDYSTTSQSAAIGSYLGRCNLSYRGDLDVVRVTAGALGPEAFATPAPGEPPAAQTGDAPVAPLPAAAQGTTLDAGDPDGTAPATAPGPRPACVIRLSRTRVSPHRRTVVRARLGVRRVTVVARRTRRGKAIAKARTSAAGVARLVFRRPPSGRLTISVAGQPSCTPARLQVASG
jgi:Concanavalin A-like lectin/glucanases superfamily